MMINIPERALWRGKDVESGEFVVGYLAYENVITRGNMACCEDDFFPEFWHIVYPETLEPVAMKVVLKDKKAYCWSPDEELDGIHCTNCDKFLQEKPKKQTMKKFLMRGYGAHMGDVYCRFCGQRLDWAK